MVEHRVRHWAAIASHPNLPERLALLIRQAIAGKPPTYLVEIELHLEDRELLERLATNPSPKVSPASQKFPAIELAGATVSGMQNSDVPIFSLTVRADKTNIALFTDNGTRRLGVLTIAQYDDGSVALELVGDDSILVHAASREVNTKPVFALICQDRFPKGEEEKDGSKDTTE